MKAPKEPSSGRTRADGEGKKEMVRLLGFAAILLAFGLIIYFTRYVPTPEQIEFDKKFDREAVLVRTCGLEPGIASALPMKVFRFEDKLWFQDNHRWRQVDGKPDNVCDLLDIDAAHRPSPEPPVSPGPMSRLMDFFRRPEPTPTPPKEIPLAKPDG